MKSLVDINSWKDYIIFFIIFIFYSYIPTYAAAMKISIINPKNIFIISMIFIFYLNFTTKNSLFFLKIPIMKWILLHTTIVLFWFLLPNNYMDMEEFRKFIFAMMFFVAMNMLIANDDDSFSKTRVAILLVTLLAVINNVYEFFHPFAFYSENSEYNIIGRSAGFYIDPNIAGQVIVFGLIFSYTIIPNKFKIFFLFLTLVGVVVTFSRSGMLGWLIVVLLLFRYKLIDKKSSLILFIILLASILLLAPLLYDFIIHSFDNHSSNLINRLNFFAQSSKTDGSELERLKIMLAAFDLFADNPLFGAGLGVIRHWQFHVAPHNIYLSLMAQFGLVGLASYLYLLYTLVAKAKGSTKILAKIFLAYLLFMGFTSHNILTAYQTIIVLVLMSNMSYRSYIRYESKKYE